MRPSAPVKVTCATLSCLLVLCAANASAERRPLSGHVPESVNRGHAAYLGRLAASQPLEVAVGLPLRNLTELRSLLHDLYDPASPNYRRFLTVEQFTEQFGPTEADYRTLIQFANAHNLAVNGTHANRLVIDLAGSVQHIERAFHTTMGLYRHPTANRTFYAPMVEPSVEAGVPVHHVSGIDNFEPGRPMDLRIADDTVVRANATGSGPNGRFIGNDFRAAYAPGVTLDGAGQTVGLIELGPYNMSDVQAWFNQAGLPINVPIKNILLNGVDGICGAGCDDGEEVLDIDMALAMAPGLSQLLVYEGKSFTDIFNRMATDNIAKQLSCSFGFLPPDPNQSQIFMEFAAQGQNLFVASGDTGANSAKNPVFAPGDDPWVVSVGGTSLKTNGAGGSWRSESGWSGSQGGVTTNGIAIPDYQQGVINSSNQGSTTLRNIPDVSSDADVNIFSFANGRAGAVGGTSAAAPTWAGFMALVNQQAALNGKPPIGFLNPIVYAIGKGPRYGELFHDVTSGNNFNASSPSSFSAVTGYDLVTGWGSPTGQPFIDQLAGTNAAPPDMAAPPSQPTPPPGMPPSPAGDMGAGTAPGTGTGTGTGGGTSGANGGCAMGGGSLTYSWAGLFVAALALLARRRRISLKL
jgi:subtilase family serine protease